MKYKAARVAGAIVHPVDYRFKKDPIEYIAATSQELRALTEKAGFPSQITLSEDKSHIRFQFPDQPDYDVRVADSYINFYCDKVDCQELSQLATVKSLLRLVWSLYELRNVGRWSMLGARFAYLLHDSSDDIHNNVTKKVVTPEFWFEDNTPCMKGAILNSSDLKLVYTGESDEPRGKWAMELRFAAEKGSKNGSGFTIDHQDARYRANYSLVDHIDSTIEFLESKQVEHLMATFIKAETVSFGYEL